MTTTPQRRPYALEIAGIHVTLRDVQVTERAGEPSLPAEELTRFRDAAARRAIEARIETSETMRLLRKTAGLTAAELARLLEVSEQSVSKWENGRAAASVATWFVLRALAREALEGRSLSRRELEDRLQSSAVPSP